MEKQTKKILYPNMDEIGENEGILKIVSPAYAGDESELTATLQYAYQQIVSEEQGLIEAAREIGLLAADEWKHLQTLGRLIARLGAKPSFCYLPPYPIRYFSARSVCYSIEPKKMLSSSLIGEEYAVESYSRMLCKIDDEKVRAVLARIRSDEIEHVKRIEKLLKEL